MRSNRLPALCSLTLMHAGLDRASLSLSLIHTVLLRVSGKPLSGRGSAPRRRCLEASGVPVRTFDRIIWNFPHSGTVQSERARERERERERRESEKEKRRESRGEERNESQSGDTRGVLQALVSLM